MFALLELEAKSRTLFCIPLQKVTCLERTRFAAFHASFLKWKEIILSLLDVPFVMEVLSGVVMELEDCALPLLKGLRSIETK